MTVLLDTDVLVECLRGAAQAEIWLRAAGSDPFHVPGIAAMELVVGCRNAAELNQLQKFLDRFTVVWPDANDGARAYVLLRTHRLTSGLSIPDCLIAAMALSRGARLYSFNLKHFGQIAGLEAVQPYQRSS